MIDVMRDKERPADEDELAEAAEHAGFDLETDIGQPIPDHRPVDFDVDRDIGIDHRPPELDR